MRKPWVILSFVLLVATACGGSGEELEPLTEAEALAALDAVLVNRAADPGSWPVAFAERIEGQVAYRRIGERELEALFLPAPFPGIALSSVRQKYYPAWQVAFERVSEEGARTPLRADLVELDGTWCVVVHWWPAMRLEDGAIRPDFRPRSERRETTEAGYVTIAVRPPWVRFQDAVAVTPG
jgi:hypothetical protein